MPSAIDIPTIPTDGAFIRFLPYQEAVFTPKRRHLLLLWRRQAGKSFTLASAALTRMMSRRNHLCVFVSASIPLGGEFIRKEAQVWSEVVARYRRLAADGHLQLTTNADGLDLDAVCDLFEHSRLETKVWHTRADCSRSVVVAPNPATAVGWTGDVFMDEVGRIPQLREVCEAVGPIMSRQPEFLWWMATTPPPDDGHYSFELFLPPECEFPVSPAGNWYASKTGVDCHRADAWDVHAAGQPLYSLKTGDPMTPEEARAAAFDKRAWDRNFALRFLRGGASAIAYASLARAMERGAETCLAINITEEITT